MTVRRRGRRRRRRAKIGPQATLNPKP